jgi:uncharacterized protein (DUF1697 family)
MFDYIIVEEDEIEDTIANGWSLTTDEAINGEDDVNIETKAPTRKEMEIKAKELGIKFPSNIKDETLLKKINDKIKENEG